MSLQHLPKDLQAANWICEITFDLFSDVSQERAKLVLLETVKLCRHLCTGHKNEMKC